jgi:hypothetical protein
LLYLNWIPKSSPAKNWHSQISRCEMTMKHTKKSAVEANVIPQRWARPEVFYAPQGFWKQQLSGKWLKIATKADITELKKLLKQMPDALHYAAAAGQAGKIELLLLHGANRMLVDDNGDTPLALAKKANKPEAVALL